MSIQGQIIEDVVSGMSGFAAQNVVTAPSYNQQGNPAYGMQLPQPLKQTQSLSTSYVAPTSTLASFNYYGGAVNNDKSFQSNAQQSSAIRGRVASPHVYQWDAAPIQNKPQDYSKISGMGMAQYADSTSNTRSFDPKQSLRDAIASIYSEAMMLKTHQMGVYSVFKCPVENMTSDFKYIVAIVPKFDHVPLGGYHSLTSLPWVSFQTRMTDNPAGEFGSIRPPSKSYKVPASTQNPVYDKINMLFEEPGKHIYAATTIPLKVELIKRKVGDMAAQSSTIMSALESFRCVLTFTA